MALLRHLYSRDNVATLEVSNVERPGRLSSAFMVGTVLYLMEEVSPRQKVLHLFYARSQARPIDKCKGFSL